MATKKSVVSNATSTDVVTPSLDGYKGWSKLSNVERQALTVETQEVHKGLQMEAQSKLAIGEHLAAIQEILGPKKLFVSFVDHNFSMSRATAYRYIDQYKVGKKWFSPPMLEVAIARGTPIKEEVIRKMPPPKTANQEDIVRYLEVVERQPSPIADKIRIDYHTLLKECLNFVDSREKKVPGNQRTKNNWHRDLFGMLLSRWGIENPMQVTPIEVPDEMVTHRGRPKEQEAA